MSIERTKKLSVKLSEQELERWHRAADGEPLAVFVRLLVNDAVRDRLRSFGEGDGEAAIAAPAAPVPSPEEREFQLGAVVEQIQTQPDLSDNNPEIEEPLEAQSPQDSSGALLDPHCRIADIHWQIKRGERCPECEGLAL